MNFDEVECDETCIMGDRNKGFGNLMQHFEAERLLIAAESLGLAEAAYDDAIEYASKRKQFGTTIDQLPQIQTYLTDMRIGIVNMKNLLYRTSWKKDQNYSIRLDSALAKRYICKTASEVCSYAMQIIGGLGYTTETRVSRAWLDSRGWQIGGGTDEIMVRIAARQLLKEHAENISNPGAFK
jgi:alkylation response protein AidB-like acyl-CoA dehydrogenase